MKATALKSKLLLIFTFAVTILLMFATIGTLFGYDELKEVESSRTLMVTGRIILSIGIFGLLAPQIIVFIEKNITSNFGWKRLSFELFSILVVASFVSILLYYMIPIQNEALSGPRIHPIAKGLIFNLVLGAIIFAVNEIMFSVERNNSLQLSITTLEKEQMGLKLNALQQRLDPHFMFNSLNVLSELVHEDSNKADRFISQFSKVYRYVLELNKESLVSLEKELDFLESYQYLLDIRMGNSLQIDKVDFSKYNHHLIPPLSLQLLLENAIKHNAASKDNPLHIELYCELDMIVMRNKKRSRTSTMSSGFGLIKLMDTYKLLGAKEPTITEDDDSFIVSLPLINSEQ